MNDNNEVRIISQDEIAPMPVAPEEGVETSDEKASVIKISGAIINRQHRIIRFNGRAMLLEKVEVPRFGPFDQYVPLHKEKFDSLAYPLLGGVSRSRVSDAFQYVINTAPDLSAQSPLILFGSRTWNSTELRFEEHDPQDVVWRSPWEVKESTKRVQFILDLAGGDEAHYEDILQSMAPLVMNQKPDGVMWWVGSGANGKSSLMEALYRIFPYQLASLTVKGLTDGRDTPMLNGNLANVVKESSEGRIDDTQIYKSIGTHENFMVHKFHSQESVTIRGNMHHIFSANQVPVFNDKGYSARRRTFIIPFNEQFKSDPDFNERTFTPEMLGHLVWEIMRVAKDIRERGYRYKFSQITEAAKLDYDAEANNAEEYARELLEDGIVAFDSFEPVRYDYENWCAKQGFVPLGVGNMRRSIQAAGFERRSAKSAMGRVSKKYMIKTATAGDLIQLGMGRDGFYTMHGFVPTQAIEKYEQEKENRQALLGEDW